MSGLRLITFEAFRSNARGGTWWVFTRDLDSLGPWRAVATAMRKQVAHAMVASLARLPHKTQAAIHDERAMNAPTPFGSERLPLGFVQA